MNAIEGQQQTQPASDTVAIQPAPVVRTRTKQVATPMVTAPLERSRKRLIKGTPFYTIIL